MVIFILYRLKFMRHVQKSGTLDIKKAMLCIYYRKRLKPRLQTIETVPANVCVPRTIKWPPDFITFLRHYMAQNENQ